MKGLRLSQDPNSKGKFQGELQPAPSWPNSSVSTHQVWGNSSAQSPLPHRKEEVLQKLGGVIEVPGQCPGTTLGHRKRRQRTERPFSFVWVTHPPHLPGRRVLHFELPAAGPGSGHFSAHATGAERAGRAAGVGRHTAARGWHRSRPGPSTPPVRLSVPETRRPRLAEHVRWDPRSPPPPGAPRGGPHSPENRTASSWTLSPTSPKLSRQSKKSWPFT